MKRDRYIELESHPGSQLTDEELKDGWHFCPDWDFMLININGPERECCTCPVIVGELG